MQEEEQVPLTFDELFIVYSNFDTKKGILIDQEVEQVEEILLSQADFWMIKAGVIGKELTLTDTGMAYSKYKKWRLNYEEFCEYLERICQDKELNLDEVMEMLTVAGPPTASDMIKIA